MTTIAAHDVAARFALGDVVGEPTFVARGAMGLIWRVTTTSGEFAVKQLQEWAEVGDIPFDIELQCAAAQAGVPLPRPVLTPDGIAVADRVRVYEWVDLADALAVPVPSGVAARVGEILGRIHALGVAPPQDPDTWYDTPPTREQWESVVARAVQSRQPWSQSLASGLDFLEELAVRFAVTSADPLITCHRDFGPQNVLPSAHGGSLLVLDWENAGPGTAAGEVASSLLEWTSSEGEVDVDSARSLLTAYREATGSDVRVNDLSFSRSVITHLNFLKVMADQAIHDEDNREFAAGWVPKLLPDRLRTELKAIEALASADL